MIHDSKFLKDFLFEHPQISIEIQSNLCIKGRYDIRIIDNFLDYKWNNLNIIKKILFRNKYKYNDNITDCINFTSVHPKNVNYTLESYLSVKPEWDTDFRYRASLNAKEYLDLNSGLERIYD